MKNLYLIASGKGGVGKSTVCANLAAAAAAAGHRVLCVDADITMRNLDLFFGLQDSVIFDSQDVCLGRCAPVKAIVAVPGHRGLDFLAAPVRMDTVPTELYADLFGLCGKLAEEYDYVFADCPGGTGWLRSVREPFVKMICVAVTDPTSLRDAEKIADLGSLCGIDDVSLILNRASGKLMRKGLVPSLHTVIDQVNLKLLGIVPEDPDATVLLNSGRLLMSDPKRKAAKAFRNIAARLDGADVPLMKL